MEKSLKRLVIDSATPYLYIALLENDIEMNVFYEEGKNDHSVKLMSEIEKMFKSSKYSIDDIDEIIIGIGTGSYTGLRIGVVVAKMLGWTKDIPVKTVSSLALIASSSNGKGPKIAAIDARRGNAFCGYYEVKEDTVIKLDEEVFSLLDSYKLAHNGEVIMSGIPKINKIINSELLTRVKDIHNLSPNYLRITEAERNIG